jgi:putative DNA primase/helicase
MAEYRGTREEELEEERPEEPTLRRTVIDDTTVEALVVRLEENPRGFLVAKDELSGWVRGLDQYKGGKGSDRQFYLSVWSNSPVMVDRKARKDPLMIPRPFLALTGAIQPFVLSELKNHREDGLLDRFLFGYPNPVPSRWTDDEISGPTLARYHELYDQLYDLAMGVDENGEPAPERLRFTVGAKAIFVEEADALREEMERPGFPDHLKGPWSKLEAYLARLSLILALVRVTQQEPLMVSIGEVEERDVRSAAISSFVGVNRTYLNHIQKGR